MAELAEDTMDSNEDADFASGFTLETPAPKAATEPKQEPVPDPAPKVEDAPAPEPVAPQYVQITQDQFDRLQSAASKTAQMETQMSKVFGTMGDMQQIVRNLQASTPAGVTVEIPQDAFGELAEDYPDIAAMMRKGLEKSLKGIRGTAPASPQSVHPDSAAISRLIEDTVLKREIESLEDVHPAWREIVGTNADPGNEFRKWLASQPQAYQERVNSTKSATIIAKAIDSFNARTTIPVKKPGVAPSLRAERIREAIQPKGIGGQAGPTNTEDDEFRAGFEGR